MNKTECLELENKVLKGMLSDIQKSIQKLDEDTATGEDHVNNIFRALGSIEYISGSFSEQMKFAEKFRCPESTGGGQT